MVFRNSNTIPWCACFGDTPTEVARAMLVHTLRDSYLPSTLIPVISLPSLMSVWRVFFQGYIWRRGYANGGLVGEVYGDVEPAFQKWTQAGKRLAIYSSGSREACITY